MKVLQTVLFMLLIGTVTSCSKDDGSEDLTPVTEPFFMKINGNDFVGLDIVTFIINGTNQTINISAKNLDGVEVVLGLTGVLDAGEQFGTLLDLPGTNVFVPVYDLDTGGFFATTGRLTIVSHDVTNRIISGRFSFSGTQNDNGTSTDINVTEGEFMVEYGPL